MRESCHARHSVPSVEATQERTHTSGLSRLGDQTAILPLLTPDAQNTRCNRFGEDTINNLTPTDVARCLQSFTMGLRAWTRARRKGYTRSISPVQRCDVRPKERNRAHLPVANAEVSMASLNTHNQIEAPKTYISATSSDLVLSKIVEQGRFPEVDPRIHPGPTEQRGMRPMGWQCALRTGPTDTLQSPLLHRDAEPALGVG
ncbi:hypothetical protein BJX96DRAFT_11054 [Aspergillus floccosus]